MAQDLRRAKKKLLPSNLDAGLPGREAHTQQLYNFIFDRLKVSSNPNKSKSLVPNLQLNKTIFMCGVPGTGKTATLNLVMDKLENNKDKRSSQIHPFKYAYINAQHLSSSDKIYTEIVNKFTKQRLPRERCIKELDKLFLVPNGQRPTAKDTFYIVAIDELDLLCNERRNTILYSLFDWPTSSNSKLILITIANAMDLAERLRGRLASRIGWEKIVFESYTKDCLDLIISKRLDNGLMNKTFDANAIALAVRKIGRTTGDARRILDTCCLAIDKALELKQSKVTTKIISEIGFQAVDSDRLNVLKTCPPLQLLTLKCIIEMVEFVGEENFSAEDVYGRVLDRLDNVKFREYFSNYLFEPKEFCNVLTNLAAASIIHLEHNKPLSKRKLFIKDQSQVFKDAIRNESVEVKFR